MVNMTAPQILFIYRINVHLMVRNDQQIQIFGRNIKLVGHVFVGEVSLVQIYGVPYAGLRPDQIHDPAHLADIQQYWRKNIG